MYYPSGVFRKKALAALKGHWQTALLIALVVNLPTLLMQGFSIFTGNDVLDRFEAIIVSASRDGILSEQLLLDEARVLLSSTSFWVIRGLEAVAWLITPCLSLGMYVWLLNRLRGVPEEPVNTVFCRTKYFFKAIGLQLMIILKVLLWMLPGLAVLAFVMRPLYSVTTQEQLNAAVRSFYGMLFPVILLIAVPTAIAALRYALAEYMMADRPESKIMQCIRRSKELMQERKKQLFFLLASFILWYLLMLLISSMLAGILSLVFQMLAGLALSVYMYCSVSAFYLYVEEADRRHEDPEKEPEPEELN